MRALVALALRRSGAVARPGGAWGDEVRFRRRARRTAGVRDPENPAFADVPGRFPSLKRSDGARTEDQRLRLGAAANEERDSKQVDRDQHDSGFFPRIEPCEQESMPDSFFRGNRKIYLNAWLDWSLDGDWRDIDLRCGPSDPVPEWRVRNWPDPGSSCDRRPNRRGSTTTAAGGSGSARWRTSARRGGLEGSSRTFSGGSIGPTQPLDIKVSWTNP